MKRSIAILTLALTAALSADEAFAQYATDTCHVDEYGTISMAAIAIPNLIEVIADVDPDLGYRILRKKGFTHRQAKSVVHLASLAFKDGPEAAYEMLRDMGFTDREAMSIVLDDLTIGVSGGRPDRMSLMQSFSYNGTSIRSEQRPDDRDD